MIIAELKIKCITNNKSYKIKPLLKDMAYNFFKQLMPQSSSTFIHGEYMINHSSIDVIFNGQFEIDILFPRKESKYLESLYIRLKGSRKYIKFIDFLNIVYLTYEYDQYEEDNEYIRVYDVSYEEDIKQHYRFRIMTKLSKNTNKFELYKLEIF